MRISLIASAFVGIAAISSSIAVSGNVAKRAASTEPLHLTLANELVDGILAQADNGVTTDATGTLTNRYGGAVGSYYITFAEPDVEGSVYSNFTRCAPFLTQLFKAAYGWTPPKAIGNSPDPKKYYNSIVSSANGFSSRAKFSDWQPGDILASPYYDDSSNIGHVMLMLNAEEISYDPATETREYAVLVLDSSSGKHTSDTRVLYPALKDGVGRGVIKVKTVQDQPTQWAWKVTSSYYNAADRPLAVGKINQ